MAKRKPNSSKSNANTPKKQEVKRHARRKSNKSVHTESDSALAKFVNNSPYGWIIPHVGVIAGFLLLMFIYFAPVFQGQIIDQHDILQYKGMSSEVAEYRENTGEEILWTNAMFGGMPTFQLGIIFEGNLLRYIESALHLGLPRPINYMFLMFIGFYFLLITLRVNPWISGIGALAFALSSYYFIILDVGHNSKTNAVAYMAPVIAGIIMAYRGRVLLGGAITALFLALEVNANHFQITFYLHFIIIMLGIAFFVEAIRKQQIPQFVTASAVLLFAAALAIGPNISRLWTTYEYGKETIRGKTELTTSIAEGQKNSDGLDKEYALRWSYGKLETFTLLVPNIYGGATGGGQLGKNSESFKYLSRGRSEGEAASVVGQMPTYWGPQPNTSGPVYVGAIVCLLFILGLLLVEGPLKWWLLAGTIFSFLLSWGRNFMPLSDLFFYNYPMYNKFRAVAMILVIAEFTMPLLAALALHKVVEKWKGGESQAQLLNALKIAGGITGGLILFVIVLGATIFDFKGAGDQSYGLPGELIKAIEADRANMLYMDAFRSLFFVAAAAALLWAFMTNRVKQSLFYGGLAVLILVDMWGVDRRYLNGDSFEDESSFMAKLNPSPVNMQIQQDKDPNFRVLNLTTSTFNDAVTSYHHKSTGGYHAAKLRRYQELIERHIGAMNPNVLNILNTKYVIQPDQNRQPQAIPNRNALGHAWFVESVQLVENADAEIAALKDFDPKKVAFVDKRFEKEVGTSLSLGIDSTATVSLQQYKPGHMIYEVKSAKDQFVLFSEIFYRGNVDWKSYIDGEEVPHFRANYVLRAMKVPAGTHTIEFKFSPNSYHQGESISFIASILLFLITFGIIGLTIYRSTNKKE